MVDRPCAICANTSSNRILVVREMMFGLREPFEYSECSHCGTLQLCTPPDRMDRFYPKEYYPDALPFKPSSGLSGLLHHERARYCLTGKGLLGATLRRAFGRPRCGIFGNPDYYAFLSRCSITFASHIADVGCGSALLLQRLYRDGFVNLTGIDPYVQSRASKDGRLKIVRSSLEEIHTQFDLIMMHHTFEHLSHPLDILRHAFRLLAHGSFLLIRIPIASSFAYRHYGVNWAQIDAPRHLFLHTVEGIKILAQKSGFLVSHIEYDSTEFQFWASEQYVRDIPLRDARSHAVDPSRSLFSQSELSDFQRRAAELNRQQDGDSACFFLQKPEC